jgi:hypothetical protein
MFFFKFNEKTLVGVVSTFYYSWGIAHRYFYLLNITQPYQILILSVILNLLRRQTIKQGANILLQFTGSQRYFYILKYNQTRFNCDCFFFKYKEKIYSLVNILYSWGVDKSGHLYFLTYHGKFQLVHVTSHKLWYLFYTVSEVNTLTKEFFF